MTQSPTARPEMDVADVLNDRLCDEPGCCGPITATSEQMANLLAEIERRDAELAERMPDEQAAIRQLRDAYVRLEKLGWRDAIYCPKDGTTFDVIEPPSTGIHTCSYYGEWPKGSWDIHADGDLWPSRPLLYRAKQAEQSAQSKGGE